VDRYLPLALMLAVVPGFIAGRRRDLRDAAARIFRVIYRLSLPCTPFVLAAAPLRESALAVLAVWAASTVVLLLGATYARLRFAREDERAAFTLSAYWSNTGWLGLPVCAALLGTAAVPAAALYAYALAPAHMVLGGTVAARGGGRAGGLGGALKANTALLPALLGAAWALSGVPYSQALATTGTWVLLASTLPAFVAFGFVTARSRLVPDTDVAAAVLLRLGASPALLAGAALLVPMPRAFLLQAGMATGLNTLTMANEHGLPVARVAPVVAWSTGLVVVAAGAWLVLT
jgi:malonate transporter and related proteins